MLLFAFLAINFAQAQGILLTETELANSLAVPKEDFENQTKSLGAYLQGQTKVLKECQKNTGSRASLCALVLALEQNKEKTPMATLVNPTKFLPPPAKINNDTIGRAQQANPNQLLDLLKGYQPSEVITWLPRILARGGCPQNLLIASMRSYEVLLPSIRAQASLELAYKRVNHCMLTSHPFYEITHLRQGLLRTMWGDAEGAQRAFRLALRTDDPKMREVTLYWLGFTEKTAKIKKVYWDNLIEEYPLTYHAIAAAKETGRDLYSDYQKRPLLKPMRITSDKIGALSIQWLESLYMFGNAQGALALSYRVTKRLRPHFSQANLAYIAALGDKYSLPGDAMSLSSFIIRKVPGILNTQTLKFLYPKPFERTFDRMAKRIDPLLTLSVAKQESGFNPYARSPANARGLLQIMPATAHQYEKNSQKYLYDIDTNLDLGGKILADLVGKFGRLEFALAAYNAGNNRVDDWKRRYDTSNSLLFIDLIPYNETRGYVAAVLRNHYWYTSLYESKKSL